jgi:hypothetical protein
MQPLLVEGECRWNQSGIVSIPQKARLAEEKAHAANEIQR